MLRFGISLLGLFAFAMVFPQVSVAQTRGDEVSFVGDVVPIINSKCGNCHVTSGKGRYRISSFKELMDSSSVEAGDPDSSLFIEVIENGEMPKGGLKVDRKELETLRKWIAQGAKFDGDDEKQSISARGKSARGGFAGRTQSQRGGSSTRGSGRRPRRNGTSPGGRRSPFETNKLIAFLDLNGDGQLSLNEIDAAKRLLYSLDRNEDDRLTEDELKEFGK